ncbi:MAG: hypothetical protein M3O62_01450 [Pseudomonadota bacterium]|nr:hypothetical protein [Pseudomonadota bacterium]
MRIATQASFRYVTLAAATLLGACASVYNSDEPVAFYTDVAVPVDRAVPYLSEVVGQRITVSGVPRQKEGSCSGVHPLARKDWMLTGETECLWVSGRSEDVRLLDLRGNRSGDEVSVTGELVRTDAGIYVLRLDR